MAKKTTRHDTRTEATKHLLAQGFAFSRKAQPQRWYHEDGRQAFIKPAGRGYVVEYRAGARLKTHVWEQPDGSWRWRVSASEADAEPLAQGTAASQDEADDLVEAVVSATRLRATGRVRPKRRRRL